jgi:hypothetical protein
VLPLLPAEEELLSVAMDNAGFADELDQFRFRTGQNREVHMQPMNITHNHLNLIPAGER